MLYGNITVNDSLKGVNTGLRNVAGELKNANTEVGVFGRDSEKLVKVQEALIKQYELHSKKVDIYKDSIEKTSSKMQDNIKERDKLKDSLDKANKSYEEAVELYGKESKEAKEAKDNVSELSEEHKKKSDAVESNAKSVERYEGNLARANSQMTKAKDELSKVNVELDRSRDKWIKTGETLEKTGEKLQTVGKGMTDTGNAILKATAPLVGVGVAAIKVSADFEEGMSKVKALSGATGDDFDKLQEKAKEMGSTTSKSATESADGMANLALAGWDTQQILGGIEPILRLAEAGNIDLARASSLTTDSMNAMGIEVEGLPGYLDVLAQTSRSSSTDIDQLAEAYLGVGGTLKNLNIPLEESATVLGLMANNGIKGSEAGNSLSSVMTNLTAPVGKAKEALEELGFSAFDSEGNFKGLEHVLKDLDGKLEGTTEEQRNMYLSMIGGKEHVDTLNAMLGGMGGEYDELKGKIGGAEGALDEMATTMQDNAKGDITKLKSELEGVGIQLGEVLIPMARDFIGVLSEWVQKFADLDPKTKEMIVKTGLFAVGLGTALSVGGKVVSGAGTLIKTVGLVTKGIGLASTASAAGATAIGGVGTAAGAAAGAGGLAGLATGFGAAVVAAAPFLLAGAAVVGVGVAIHHGLKQEVIPEVDLFADKIETTASTVQTGSGNMIQSVDTMVTEISKGTKEAVGAYMGLHDGAKEQLDDLYINSTVITTDIKEDMITKFAQMGETVNQGLKDEKEKALKNLTGYFLENSSLTVAEQQDILSKTNAHYEEERTAARESQEEVQAILEKASEEKRELTLEEVNRINELQDGQREQAINTLSEQAIESEIILERMKGYDERITAEQAEQHIQKLNETRDESVKIAEDEYDKRIAEIIKMRDESGVISAEQAEKMMKDAKDTKDDVIKKAEEMRDGAVEKMRQQHTELDKLVDVNTGKILTNWDKLKNWWNNWEPGAKNFEAKLSVTESAGYSQVRRSGYGGASGGGGSGSSTGANWRGNDNFHGGRTTLHEKGYEVYQLPQGTRIFNHEASQDQVLKTAEAVARRIVANSSGSSGSTQNVTINSPSPMNPSEVARRLKNVDRELAMGI